MVPFQESRVVLAEILSWGEAGWLLLPVVLVFGAVLGVVPLLVYLERKICALIQDRVGPNRVGLFGPSSFFYEVLGVKTKTRILGGLIQPFADAVKLLTKEDFIPAHAERLLFTLAPFFALLPPFLAFVVVPVGADILVKDALTQGQRVFLKFQVADLNVGILWILSVASLSAYGVSLGGWASNSKYALLGGIRATAQMISYEVALGIVILSVIMHYGTVSLRTMVEAQVAGGLASWGVWHQPLACLLFVVCAFAENNRLPFDMPECEAELVGGYHTEYNSMKFALFFQGEYIAMLSMGALLSTIFFGGWHFPFYHTLRELIGNWVVLISLVVFASKTMAFAIFSIWIRWTLPRFRYDQVMGLGWKIMIPLALLNLLLTAFASLS